MVLYGWGFEIMADMLLGAMTCLLLLRFGEEAARAAHDALRLLHVDVSSSFFFTFEHSFNVLGHVIGYYFIKCRFFNLFWY